MSKAEDKQLLRQQMRAHLSKLSKPLSLINSEKICTILTKQALFTKSTVIALYFPRGDEADLLSLSAVKDKVYCLPFYDEETGLYRMKTLPATGLAGLKKGKFGIAEPDASCPNVSAEEIDLWLVPGLAFGKQGERLGRGKGFYDRLMQGATGFKLGCCFDFQIQENLALEEHDIRLNGVITENNLYLN